MEGESCLTSRKFTFLTFTSVVIFRPDLQQAVLKALILCQILDDVTIVAGVEINRGIKSEVLGRTSLLSFVIILIIVLVIIIIVVVISYELRDWPQINEGNSRNLSLCKTRCFVIQLFHTYLWQTSFH